MKTKNKIGAFIGLTFSFLIVGLGFQNCAQQVDMASLEANDSVNGSSTGGTDTLVTKVESDLGVSPTDAKQSLESMMSLLGLTPKDINMNEVNSEINYRRNLLVPQNDITLLNSPSIIAMTSLAGVVCKQAVNKEKKGTRDIFKFIDFAQGPKAYGKMGAINTYISLVDRLWMRKPSKEELQAITEAVDEYFSTLDSTAMGKAAESDKLAIFICTGMLAVPESYLL
nr:hypothetical protein [uncultured Bdellovibrio sp.]